MKKISAVCGIVIFLLITTFRIQAQTNTTWQATMIDSYRVAVAFTKTTNIIFPYAIVGVDVGSRDVLAQKAKGVENILQLKAAREGFPQTNASIVTADGRLTSFLVDYAAEPSVLTLSLGRSIHQQHISIPSGNINQEQMESAALAASDAKEKMRGLSDKTSGVRLMLNGIFICNEVMLLRIHIANKSNIIYDIDQLRLYIRDQKKSKRTATQEIEILPVFTHNNTTRVMGQSDHTIVLAVPKFTIPDKKYFVVQLMEKDGGRHPELHVKNKKIVKAVSLN